VGYLAHIAQVAANRETGADSGALPGELEEADIMDRLEACRQFNREHPVHYRYIAGRPYTPPFIYGHTHVVIEDYNFEDGYIYRAIANLALDLARGSSEFDMPPEQAVVALKFLVGLLDLPLPDDWDE
jgi:hypothetical protein